MKKIIIPIIGVVIIIGLIIGGYLVIDHLFPKAEPITVSASNTVISMTVAKNEKRTAGEQREIESTDFDRVLSLLSKAAPTRKMSVQDSPDAQVYYQIAAKTNDRTH